MDVHLEGILGLVPDKSLERPARRLKSGNKKKTKEYLDNLRNKLESHNVFQREWSDSGVTL